MKRILVTGGMGFIGSHFVRWILKKHSDWEVVNYDKLTYSGNPENLREVEGNPRYRFVQGDICDSACLEDAARGIDALVHLAAQTHVDRSIDDDLDFLQTNILGTRNVLDVVRRHQIPRYVQISTDEVYGSLEKGSANEDSPLKPNSPYAASKAAADLWLRAYQRTYQIPGVVVRSSNNFGPFQYPEKIIPLFITNLLEEKKVPLYARGENRRDWIYVEDNCEAIALVLERGKDGEVYNIGGGKELSNLELTTKILQSFGRGEEWIQFVADRPGHDFRYALDSSKIQKLGFRSRHSFEEALAKTLDWYRNHPAWWQPLRKDKFTLKLT